jgi:hypothetical protein
MYLMLPCTVGHDYYGLKHHRAWNLRKAQKATTSALWNYTLILSKLARATREQMSKGVRNHHLTFLEAYLGSQCKWNLLK